MPFFFKQWGAWTPATANAEPACDTIFVRQNGQTHTYGDCEPYSTDDACMYRVGKRLAGRRLDGREHNDYPDVA